MVLDALCGGDGSRGLVTVALVLFDVIIVVVMWMMALVVVVVMALRCGSAGGCSDDGADLIFFLNHFFGSISRIITIQFTA